MIAPTVGRVVWFYLLGLEQKTNRQPYAAQVARVNEDGTVNLGYLGSNGNSHNAMNVPLVQEGEAPPARDMFCEWMPYQVDQARKHDQIASSIATAARGFTRIGIDDVPSPATRDSQPMEQGEDAQVVLKRQ